MSAAACHRPEPDLHVIEATGNAVRCDVPSGRNSQQSSRGNDATGNGNDHPICFETKGVPQEIITEVVSLGMARSFLPVGHLYQEELAPSCGGSPTDTHVSSAPEHLEKSAGQVLEGRPVFLLHEDQVGPRAIHVKASLVEREVR